MMDQENKPGEHPEGCRCGRCAGMGGNYFYRYFFLRWLLLLLVLAVVFWVGVKVGEFKSYFESGFGPGMGGYHRMMLRQGNMFYQQGTPFMNGQSGYPMMNAVPSATTPATTSPASKAK